MGLDGGGGGGGGILGVTGSFTGPAEALEIYGDFAAAYSGPLQVATSNVQYLNFTSGNYLFVGSLTFSGPINITAVTTGGAAVAEISFNGTVVLKLKVETGQEDMPTVVSIPVLIPAYTEILVEVNTDTTGAGSTCNVDLVGRIYR